MNDTVVLGFPKSYNHLLEKCHEIGFTMPSDLYIGSLLKTLISSKPGSNILEMGTGMGLSLSWMIDGMDVNSKITTIDKNQNNITAQNIGLYSLKKEYKKTAILILIILKLDYIHNNEYDFFEFEILIKGIILVFHILLQCFSSLY